jgi:hypothetical protein
MRRQTALLLILTVLLPLINTGCSDPQKITIEPWDTLLINLEYSWNSMDITLMGSCFRDDFMHHLQEADWDDYNGDGIVDEYWGLETELEFAEQAFEDAFSIEFTLSGGGCMPWSGDSTGESMQLDRIFEIKVYTDEAQSQGYQSSGQVILICRPDSQGDWYIWQWFDGEVQ